MREEKQTILVIEDDPNDALLIRRAFQQSGNHEVLQFTTDGEAAMAYLGGQGEYADRSLYPLPAFVLMDLKLPRKSGLEVLEWLREQPCLKRLPVVILTSSAESSDINRAYDLGANSYLVKPVRFQDLKEMMRNLGFYWLLLNNRPDVE